MSDLPNVDAIFRIAFSIEPSDIREEYLKQACSGNQALHNRVIALLRVEDERPDFLESSPTGDAATLNFVPIAERPGIQIGPYKLIQEIGEGGMGIVYMALQREPARRKVALKIIKPGMDTREVTARFAAEQQALALMDHPNIAHVFDAGTTESGRPYFVMELVNGEPLTEYCDDNTLPTRERLELFILLCQAIQHAHQKGIIHRDLKPSNVLVTLHDGIPVPKIIDFGIAKATNQELTSQTWATGLGNMIGTPLYMSPEQAERSGLDIDTRSDIYSLGALLYELLTGSTPFDREQLRDAGLDEIRRLIREQEPPKPSTRISALGQAATTVSEHRRTDPVELSNSLRRELDWIVMKALEKDRTRRYETATDFARDIQRYLNDEAVEACPPTRAYRLHKFTRRNRIAILTTAVIGLALILGAGVAAGQAYRATKAEKLAGEQLQIATEQQRLAKRQARLAKTQKQAAEDQRQLAVEMLALATGDLDASGLQTGPDGSLFAFCRTGQVLRCDARTGVLIDEFANFSRQEPVSRYQRLFFGSDLTGDGQAELYALGYETVRILDGVSGKSVKVFTRESGSATPGFLGRDEICVGPDGLIYDLFRGGVRRYDGQTLQFIDTFVKSASPAVRGDVCMDGGTFTFGPDGNLYAAFWGLHNIERYDARTGALLNEFVPTDTGRLRDPRAMAFGPDGNLYVVTANHLLIYSGANGHLLRDIPAELGEQFCSLFFQPTAVLCVSANDKLLRLDETSGRLEPLIRYRELMMHYVGRRVGEEPGLRTALKGSELQNTLAWCLVWQRGTSSHDAELGVRLATAAMHDAPNNGPIWHTLGVALYRAGQWEEARAALVKSDELCGPTAYVDFFLSMVYARLGNIVQARAAYDRSCELMRDWDYPVADDSGERESAPPQGELRFRGILGLLSGFQKEAADLLGINRATELNKSERGTQPSR